MTERFSRPGKLDDVELFVEDLVTFFDVDTEAIELVSLVAAADAPFDSAFRKNVEHGDFFCDPERMHEGKDGDRGADLDRARARGEVRGGQMNCGTDAVTREVMFGEPRAVVALGLGARELLEFVVKDFALAAVFGPLHQAEC